MPLKLMYITNRPDVALVAERAGVDRLFVDMEVLGKAARQGGMDTVQSAHTLADVCAVKEALTKSELLVRVNPLHAGVPGWPDSAAEVDAVVDAGADVVMLPYFRTAEEAAEFVELVRGRARTCLLVETPEAARGIQGILRVRGVDEVYVGLNDLTIGRGGRFLFEPLADSTVDAICHSAAAAGIPYGFGGIASPGRGAVPAEMIIREHYRLGSSMAILSRAFLNVADYDNLATLEHDFVTRLAQVRALERECEDRLSYFERNRRDLVAAVAAVVA